MIIRSVKLVNFGPFFGEHTVDVHVGDESSVILIHGENMRGKTSFINAIKWCLYGTVKDRRGQTKGTHRLLSYDAIDAGEFHMSVHLDFDHAGVRYLLERHVQADKKPQRPSDMSERAFLRRDGHIVPEETIVEEIGNILHPTIARFFLFDGEMLDEYEILLGDPSRSTSLVKTSIEQILGLPALHLMAEDLGELQRDAERRQLRAVEAAHQGEQLTARANQQSNELQALDDDLGQLTDILHEIDQEIVGHREQFEAYAEVQTDIREADRLTVATAEAEAQLLELQEEVRSLLATAWWAPTAGLVDENLKEASLQLRQATTKVAENATLRAELDQLETAHTSGTCPLCSQNLGAAREALDERRVYLTTALSDLIVDSDLPRIAARVEELGYFSDRSAIAGISDRDARIRRLGIDMRRDRRSLDGIRDRLKQHDVPSIREIEIRLEAAIRHRETLAADIETKEDRRRSLRSELSRLNQEIQRLPGADKRTAAEAALYGALQATFTTAIDGYRDQLRLDVQESASTIFQAITTESGYAGLTINERYGLSIVDDTGRIISDRSAGAEQVVALSLIGALNASAVREGPVVMDTPFGRLDVRHRENMLKYLRSMSSQVILLVQSGEFRTDMDRPHLEDHLAHEYWLVRDGSPTRSRIERQPGETREAN